MLIRILILLLILFASGSGAFWLWESRYPVSLRAVKRLEQGATQDQIKQQLGPPTKVYDFHDGKTRWAYYQTGKPVIVYIIFDTNLLYTGFKLDDSP
jgi:hypothetical protein